MTRSLRFVLCTVICLLALSATNARAGLIVDLALSSGSVPATAAPFVFVNNAAGPQTRIYTHGSQGYTGGAFDLGAGVTTVLQGFLSTNGSLLTSAMRMLDRTPANVDLFSDWTAIEPVPVSGIPTVGLHLRITGLASGSYSFASLHRDTGGQTGVLDAQYSLNGGSTWINLVDNLPYPVSGTTVSVNAVSVNSTFGLSIRYLAGGNLFGGNGQTTDTVASNRLMPLNSFQLTYVPEPSSMTLLLVATFIGLSFRRRVAR